MPSGAVLAVAAVAFLAGLLVARLWLRPLSELGRAAAELGRGRFDIAVPHSRIPEVRHIGAALVGAARGMEARVAQERDFVANASHVIRTPITGLRLELEDLHTRSDVALDVREAAGRCLAQVDRLATEADAVLAEARGFVSIGRPTSPVELVARAITRRWSNTLAAYESSFRAHVEGDLDAPVTHGFAEQILDRVLEVIVAEGSGRVELRFVGEPGMVRIEVTASGGGEHDPTRLAPAASLTETVGGTLSGSPFAPGGLRVLLPGR